MKNEKSYKGELMDIGTKNEVIVFNWLQMQKCKVIDFRQFKLLQGPDVDCSIVSIDGQVTFAEIKADQHIGDSGNLCFECFRINHFVVENMFYLGWGWRSAAQKLIVRNPNTGITYIFDFRNLRQFIGKYVDKMGKSFKNNILVTETDKQKTTFNFLIPMKELEKEKEKLYIGCIITGD